MGLAQVQVPDVHWGEGHDSTDHEPSPQRKSPSSSQVGGHGAQSASVWHWASAQAPWEQVTGQGVNVISQVQAPAWQVGLTNVTTSSSKQPGGGGVQSPGCVQACAGGTLAGGSGSWGSRAAEPAVSWAGA